MNIVLLSGGSGKRLWPLSNEVRSKQFIKIFSRPAAESAREGEAVVYESMVQRVYRQIRAVDPSAEVTIATSRSQVSAIHNQLGWDVGISVEPCRRDTFPAIALATAYLHDVRGVSEEEAVVVCPVDPYVEEGYFQCVRKLYDAAREGKENLVLMGIEPTCPSEKYGYIKPEIRPDGTRGYTFTEKPTEKKAWEYIRSGALWNGGVFAYRLKYVLEKSRELLGSSDYRYLSDHYAELKKISFDYAVVERETAIGVIPYSGTWNDIGTWNALTEAMEEPVIGRGTLGEQCDNVHIVNELDVPVLAAGLKDVVIAASPDGILVSGAKSADRIKAWVDAMDQQIMFAEKSWGSYQVIDVEQESQTVKVTLKPGQRMNYHSHDHRDEVWTIVSGTGETILEGEKRKVKPGDVVSMPAGCRHTIIAGDQGLQLIEVQIGEEISVADKKKFEMKEEFTVRS